MDGFRRYQASSRGAGVVDGSISFCPGENRRKRTGDRANMRTSKSFFQLRSSTTNAEVYGMSKLISVQSRRLAALPCRDEPLQT